MRAWALSREFRTIASTVSLLNHSACFSASKGILNHSTKYVAFRPQCLPRRFPGCFKPKRKLSRIQTTVQCCKEEAVNSLRNMIYRCCRGVSLVIRDGAHASYTRWCAYVLHAMARIRFTSHDTHASYTQTHKYMLVHAYTITHSQKDTCKYKHIKTSMCLY